MLSKYEGVAKSFKRFFNSDELFRVLGDTVNSRQLLRVSQLKATRQELRGALTIINALYQRLTHMASLQVEMSRVLVPGRGSSSIGGGENINMKI